MGLAASQARLLFLTSRMSDLEMRAQVVSSAKIRLAEESSQVSEEYSAALDQQVLRYRNGADANGSTYGQATAANLTTYDPNLKPRIIENASGKVLVSDKVAQAFKDAQSGKSLPQQSTALSQAMASYMGTYVNQHNGQTPDAGQQAAFIKTQTTLIAKEAFVQSMCGTTDSGATNYYSNLYDQMETNGYFTASDDNMNSASWLQSQVSGNSLFLYEQQKQPDGTDPFENISWTSGDNEIQEVTDSTNTAKAEAKYEAATANIQVKDKKFDLELKNIDTEHEAVQNEIDSVKKLIDKNIERAFKMFQA